MNQEQLLAALKGRDPRAVEELVDLYGERLSRSAFLLCGNETDAQDLVQETFLQAIRSIHRFRSQSSIYTWLHSILLNLTRHYHRDRLRTVHDEGFSLQIASPSEDRPASLDTGMAASALQQALAQLSSAHREVVILRYYERMKLDEIAKLLGTSKGTVKSRLHYAIAELQKHIPSEMNLFGPCGTNQI